MMAMSLLPISRLVCRSALIFSWVGSLCGAALADGEQSPPGPYRFVDDGIDLEPSDPDGSGSSSPPPAEAPPAAPAAPPPVASEPAAPAEPAPEVTFAPAGSWSISDAQWLLGAERLLGYYQWSSKQEATGSGAAVETDGSELSLLTGRSAVSGSPGLVSPSSVPRVALSLVVGGGITLGAAFGYSAAKAETNNVVGGSSSISLYDKTSQILLAPRVGYLLDTSPSFAFWFRAGMNVYLATTEIVTYNGNVSSGAETSIQGTQVSLDPGLIYAPTDHVGLLLQGLVEIGTSGNWEVADSSVKGTYRYSAYGLSAGLVALF